MWDQATVLKQIGVISEYLPFPNAVVPESSRSRQYECQVPVAGVEAAQKMLDKNSVTSNEMFGHKMREIEQ
jgi:carboxymethylenebutenolidase